MALDISLLMEDIKTAASDIVNQDIAVLRGFSDRQLRALAKQADLITSGILTGEIDEDLQDFFLDTLEDMALNFAKTLRGLILVTMEKVWNAIVGVLWTTISNATGINIVAPSNG